MSCGAIKYMRADVHFNLSISISKKYPKFSQIYRKRELYEWTIIVWGTYISGYKCQNPWKPWYLPGFLKIWKYLNCPRGNKTKTMSFFFRFDYPSAIIFVRMRLISVWIINTVDKARAVINMNIIIYELAML